MTDTLSRTIVPFLLSALLAAGLGAGPGLQASPPGPQLVADTVPTFSHSQHETLECRACHEMDRTHGARLVQSMGDCRSCHHTERADRDCAFCHQGAELDEERYVLPRTFALTVLDQPSERDVAFRHRPHEEVECAECHAEGPSLAVPELDCQSCHDEHHEPDAVTGCDGCHREPAEDAHDLSVHVTCSSAGCHQESPVGRTPRTRPSCLWCHQDMADHKPGQVCVSCHLMPRAEPADVGSVPR